MFRDTFGKRPALTSGRCAFSVLSITSTLLYSLQEEVDLELSWVARRDSNSQYGVFKRQSSVTLASTFLFSVSETYAIHT